MIKGFFDTLFLLSIFGSILILIILVIKPLFIKKLPCIFQKSIWIIICFCMVIPFWKLIPENEIFVFDRMKITEYAETVGITEEVNENITVKAEEKENKKTNIGIIFACIYFLGAGMFLIWVFLSYIIFLRKKKKGSIELPYNESFEEVKKELNIKRHIRLRASADAMSPMLVGGIFPVVYIPKINNKEKEKMIYRHELTHYKNRDLYLKWFSLFVNALHWFNPLSYVLSSNISEVCELSCDISVIKRLNEEDKKLYMNTILELVEKERKK